MANDTKDSIDNVLIAQLNDLAYKSIRKTSVRKRLDDRTIRNEEYFKKLEASLEEVHSQIDFGKVEAGQA